MSASSLLPRRARCSCQTHVSSCCKPNLSPPTISRNARCAAQRPRQKAHRGVRQWKGLLWRCSGCSGCPPCKVFRRVCVRAAADRTLQRLRKIRGWGAGRPRPPQKTPHPLPKEQFFDFWAYLCVMDFFSGRPLAPGAILKVFSERSLPLRLQHQVRASWRCSSPLDGVSRGPDPVVCTNLPYLLVCYYVTKSKIGNCNSARI